jgi:hypothetical protein
VSERREADMSNRVNRNLLFVSCLLTISLAGFCTYRISQTPPVTFKREDLEKIRDEMTEAEVVKALGCPPGDYCTDPDISETFRTYYVDRPLADVPHSEWLSDEGMIQIYFDDGRATLKRFYPAILPRRSWFEIVRSRLGI